MKNNRAQSILEIIAMILFVAATIFIGGPTIIRGINAHFKLWDDSVQDSYNDPLRQVPTPILDLPCRCSLPVGGTGLRCGVSPCPPTQRLETILCNPAGCGAAIGVDESRCVEDPTCCDIETPTNRCGLGTTPSPPGFDCPVNYRIWQKACGSGTTQYSCRFDNIPSSLPGGGGDGNPSCVPSCIGTFHPDESTAASNPAIPVICPGDDANITTGPFTLYPGGIGIPVSIVGNNLSACSDPQKCQTYCSNCRIAWNSGCVLSFTTPPYIIPPAIDPCPCQSPNTITRNDQSFTTCFPAAISNISQNGIGCGFSGIPNSVCTIQAW